MIRKYIVSTSLFLILIASSPSPACYSIVVGREASQNGCVMLAHNEDDGAPAIVNHHKAARHKYQPGEKYQLQTGGDLDQVEETWSYIWSEMPGLNFSDSFINEWGVAVTSDNCPSREDKPKLSHGGIDKDLRILIAQRARSARQGVELAAQLVEQFGYNAPGRTYLICDPEEGWLFAVVNGKHWLAQRVPDDQVALVANTYSIRQVNLKDKDNFLASPDIIDYAVSRGWYDPKSGQPFDFATAYADPNVAKDSSNFCRQWSGLRHVSAQAIPMCPELPFSVIPGRKLDAAALMDILKDHYEWTDFYHAADGKTNPHLNSIGTICNWNTQTAFVAELRGNMPNDIGLLYWVCLAQPCRSVFLPFHFGISAFPAGWTAPSAVPTQEQYQSKVLTPFRADAEDYYWTMSNLSSKLDQDYSRFEKLNDALAAVQKNAFVVQQPVEQAALDLYLTDRTTALALLDNYCRGIYLQTVDAIQRSMNNP
ncbi:MAG: C69 family dipeptidase [bacterium]|nr:C69 family dipeptidase [bacterium]